MRLIGYKSVKGKIVLESGLHIGGSQEATQIGGVDNPVIRQPLNGYPYIPGSSLKGKMRSLLEMKYDKLQNNGELHKYERSCKDSGCEICHIFGAAATDSAEIGPGRLVVRDAMIHPDSEKDMLRLRDERGLPFAEDKPEIALNRMTAWTHLRTMERVPAGLSFGLDLSFRVFDRDGDGGAADEQLFEKVLEGLAMIEKDTLGGSGSRGYGKVRFEGLTIDGLAVTLPEV